MAFLFTACGTGETGQLVGVMDEIVPYKLFEIKTVIELIPAMIEHKINEMKSNCTTVNKTERIKVLNKDIKSHFNKAKASKVRRSIQPGNKSSLWKAVKTAKDHNLSNKIDHLTRVTCRVKFSCKNLN